MPTFRKGKIVFEIQGSVEKSLPYGFKILVDHQAPIDLPSASKEIQERAEVETLRTLPTEPEYTAAFYDTCIELQGHVIAR
jgi:hypothetical protein